MSIISVIVPIYNVEKYLNRCVDSILNQTFNDFECILVDDGSPDNCGEICDDYAKKDKRIRVIHKENGGLSDARNAGIEIAKGEYLSFIDSDDWIHPQMLEILYYTAINNNVILSACDWCVADKEFDFCTIENPKVEVFNGLENLFTKCDVAVMTWNKLYHKSLFDDIRFPTGRLHEDEFTVHKFLYKAGNIALCREKLYAYFINPNSIMQKTYSLKRLDAICALESQYSFFKSKKISEGITWSIRRIQSVGLQHLSLIDLCANEKNYRKSKRKLLWKIRKYLLVGCMSGRISISDYFENFKVLFPTVMKFYIKIRLFNK